MGKILENLEKEIDINKLIVENFNTPLAAMDRSFKQNISKDIAALNNALDQMDLTDMYVIYIYIKPFIPKKQNTQSSQMHMEYFQR